MALAGVVVGTFAVSQNSTVLNNVFEIANYETQFIEEFDAPSNWKTCDTVDKKIYVKNNTDVDIVARVKLDEEWNATNGMGLPLVSNGSGERMAIVNMTDNSGWTLDGTYYYSPTLAPGQTSTSVISGVTLNCDANLDEDYRYGNAEYKLSAKVETIQADRASTEWHKVSVLLPLNQFNGKLSTMGYNYWNRTGKKNLKFLQADSLGLNAEDITAGNIVSYYGEQGSNTYTYAWLDEDAEAIYWYSDADDVYMSDCVASSCNGGSTYSYINDLSGFYNINMSRVTKYNSAFQYYGGSSLHGLEKWDVSNAVTLNDMFWTSSDGPSDISALSRWDVSNVTDLKYMFNGALFSDVSPLAGWNVKNVTDYRYIFQRTNVDESLCALADWPIKKDAAGTYFVYLRDNTGTSAVDLTCLDKWGIEESNRDLWFRNIPSSWILPVWARRS